MGVESAEKRRIKMLLDAGFKTPESMEVRTGQFSITGFPAPDRRYFLSVQNEKLNIEHNYYWLLQHAMNDFNLPYSLKITDSTASSVSSSFFGDMQGRLSAQQGSVSNYLASVGKMVRDMFGLVRELRQIRERLGYYEESTVKNPKVADVAEKTLKGIWIDLVEGGSQNPSSVLGLAQKVGFTILPDLFFAAPPMPEDRVDEYVKDLNFNAQVKNMLARKLYQYYRWKKETHEELRTKRNFQIRYLRQHFDTIRMYLAWLKPYLKHIEMLHLDPEKMQHDANLISSFQSQIIEIETLVYGNPHKGVYPVVSFHFYSRSTPAMDFHAKDSWQQKGPIHIGKTEVTIRVYTWTEEEMQKYHKMRNKEDFSLLTSIDNSLKDAVKFMGKEMEEFLDKAELDLPDDWLPGKKDKKEKKSDEPPRETVYGPFVEVGKGMISLFKPLVPKSISLSSPFSKDKKEAQKKKAELDAARKAAYKDAHVSAWMAYKNYKKAHQHFSW